MIKACTLLGVLATALAWPGAAAAAAFDGDSIDQGGPARIVMHDPGGPRLAQAQQPEGPGLHRGVGVVVEAVPGQDMLIVDHEEIPGFMGPMVMGYAVASPELLQGLEAGDAIEFTVDAEQNAIVDLRPRTE